MKILQYARKALALTGMAASLVLFTGCDNDDDDATPPDTTISGTVIASPNFSILETALSRAGLVEALRGAGPFTVFAPDNDAFAASGITEATINSLPLADLQAILTYHVLPAEVPASAVPAGPNAKVSALSTDSLFVTKNSAGVFINGVQVKTADVDASNGVIHVISRVLLPAGANNIVQTVQKDTSLTYLVAAVLRASEGTVNVANVLSTTNALTVFAPTNNAFRAAGYRTIADIQGASPATLTGILTYHVIGARVFSSDLAEGAQPTTLNTGKVTITLAGGAKVKGNSNPNPANIIATNIMGKNGVIHKIDGVLLP